MVGAWAKVRRGAAAPLVVVRRAKLAGEPWHSYVRLVRLHLLLAALALAVAGPFVLTGVESFEVSTHGLHVEKKAKHAAKAPPPKKRSDEDGAVEADDHSDDAPPAFLATHAPSLVPLWAALGSLYAAWVIIELAISMLWMEHLDWLTEQLARAVGLPVLQPTARAPRVRLNLRWGVQKAWRQLLAALMIASGAPFFLVASLAPKIGPTLYAIALALWTFYWVLVTTAAKSASAWTGPADRQPWFLRTWTRAGRTRVLRLFAWRWYGRAWAWLTRGLHRAALLWEARPYEFVGLAVVRLVTSLPLVSIVVKPLMPTAAELIASGALDGDEASPDAAAGAEKSRSPESA